MSFVVELLEQARASGDWNRLLEAVPYMRFLGVEVEEKDGALLGRMRASEHLVGNPTLPALHGGTLGALLEATAQLELLYRAESLVLPKTITVTVDFLRSARPVDTFVQARMVKQGRRVATVHAVAWQTDALQPVASAAVHVLVVAPGPGGAAG